jgi:hypothetical protein
MGNKVLSFSTFSGSIVIKTPLSFWELFYYLSQFYQKGGVFSLKIPLISRFFSIYFGAKVELINFNI